MVSQYVIEEYNGKYWVHKRPHTENGVVVKGELAYKKPFASRKKAQKKANDIERCENMKKSKYETEMDNLKKIVKKEGILVEKMKKGTDFLFEIRTQYKKDLGTIMIRNMRGRITNVYTVYEDHDGSIKYYDYPQYSNRDIKRMQKEKRTDLKEQKTMNVDEKSKPDFNKEEYLQHLSRDVFTVKYKVRSTGKICEINPLIDDSFWDTCYREAFRSGEYILIEGELPDKWK